MTMRKRTTSGEGGGAERTAVILDSVADGVFTVDRDWRITFFNRAAQEITGIPREEALSRPCREVFRASICESACALKKTLADGRPVVNARVEIVRSDGRRIPISISTAILRDAKGELLGGVETFRDLSEVEALRKELAGSYSFADMVAKSASMRGVFAVLPRIAESGSTILVTGESGTGKELVARAIHSLSPRKKRRFVAVNCAALPETLLESELFGHVAGAFTDARRDRKGRFAEAEGGTLFLDEIADIPSAVQAKLLRVLQGGEYEPVGSSSTVKADVRIVCATNRPLEDLVKEGRFRQDLYYRVNVVRVALPPVRERMEDIPLLVEHFLSRLAGLRGTPKPEVSQEVMACFLSHDWPGNVRELENAVEHALALAGSGRIEPVHLPAHLVPGPGEPAPGLTLLEIERRTIVEALKRNDWRRLAAARELGINKTTLWRKMKSLGIRDPEPR